MGDCTVINTEREKGVTQRERGESGEREREREREREKQTDRQTDRQTGRQTNRQTDT